MIIRVKAFWLCLLFLLLTAVTVKTLSTSFIPLNSAGNLLNPYTGLWRHRTFTGLPKPAGLTGKVTVQYDKDQIPHIFADNDADLYFAQGLVTARDRLWQMDFISRVAAGRLSEVMGEKTVELDKMFISTGLPQAAQESLELSLNDPISKMALESYAQGVNAFIKTLKPSQYPYEFKLLGYEPEEWTPLKSILLVKFMAFQLAGYNRDLALTRSRLRLNEEDFNQLFPIESAVVEPIIPREKLWSFEKRAPEPPENLFRASVDLIQAGITPNENNGSNNWAVNGNKSVTGKPIVANDVHLDYALPALWYAVQLISPTQNVMGGTIPGGPGVIIGFNRSTSWAVTSAMTDVLDWYELRFRDSNQREYLHDGDWRPVITHEHTLKVRGRDPITLSLRRTHYGPIPYAANETPNLPSIPRGASMRWAVLDPSNEIKSFVLLNRAKTFKDCQTALESIGTPAQNFICADNKNNIGIFHNGNFPIRWAGQGRMIGDGSDPAYDWKGTIPKDEVPNVINPSRGFVSSANQKPTDETYPHYLGWKWDVSYRGSRINELLKAKSKLSVDDFKQMQKDVTSGVAKSVLPTLITKLEALKMSDEDKEALKALKAWDLKHTKESVGASIWMAFWKELESAIWKDKFPDPKLFQYPSIEQTVQLIMNDPTSHFFDRRNTNEVETLDTAIASSFKAALAELRSKLGSDVSDWTWSEFQPTKMEHITKIPGLGSGSLDVAGQAQSLFANTGKHGPDWKMIVQLGDVPKAHYIFPGGQSGDPTSNHYMNLLDDWAKSELHEMNYYLNSEKTNSNLQTTIELQ